MKRRIFSVFFALVLVLSLGLVMAVPVGADVSDVTVVPTDRTAAATSKYTITMTTTEALVANTDIISIVFPTGFTPSATANAASDVTVNTADIDATGDYNVTGQRVEITVPDAVSAGTVVVVIGVSATLVTNHEDAGSYALDVYTSQEPTAVTSEAFVIAGSDTSKLVVASVVLDPYTVGVASEYTIELTLDAALVADTDTITITFPDGTTVPTSITSASHVTIEGNALDATSDYSVDGQVVTLTVPENVSAGGGACTVVFLVAAAITNPTTQDADTSDSEIDEYSLTAHTTQEPIESAAREYDAILDAGIGSLLALTAPTDFTLTPNVATTFTVKATDEYGNLVTGVTPLIRFTTTTETGTWDGDAVLRQESMSNGVVDVAYIDSTSGTHTITIKAVPQDTYTNTITQQIVVNSQVALLHDGVEVANFNTIQLAIDAAIAGDTIEVGPGTYVENLTIGVTGLTLESTAGRDTTIIDPSAGSNGIEITADGVTVEGFTVAGAGALDPAHYGIVTNGATTGVTVKNNTVTDVATAIVFQGGKATSATVSGNLISDCHGGIRLLAAADATLCTISNNEITDCEDGGSGIGLQATTSTTITGNTVSNAGWGIHIGGNIGTSCVISDNTLTGNRHDGIKTETGLTIVGLSITLNTITANEEDGIFLVSWDDTVTRSVIKYNDIYGNGLEGDPLVEVAWLYDIENSSSKTVDARYNWWGSPSGPDSNVNADSDPTITTTSPWLADDQASVVASGKSQYATSILLENVATLSDTTYSGGWNTFSTPIWLDGSANEWGEIAALVTLEYAGIYGWDGTNWTAVVASTPVTPLDAIFVQLKTEAQSLPIIFSTQLSPAPTRAMSAGWELVGQANLEAQIQSDTMASIVDKYSQVIDPISGDVIAAGTNMVVGAGYWVFVTEAGTLAGFSVTPQPFVSVTP